jgi:fucose 4-O-acetylase-like acetyltransferase
MAVMRRDLALDFAKGLLIAIMIVYHWMNFTWGPIGGINDYFRFLTPAFIFLAGWTIGSYYPDKYGTDNPQLFRRLTIRGLKLLGFFIGVNVIIRGGLNWSGNPWRTEWGGLWGDLWGIFVSGNRELMSFHILWPISLLLLLAGQGLRLASPRRRILLWLMAGALLLSQLLPVPPSRNAYLLSFGLLGQIAAEFRQVLFAASSRIVRWLPLAFALYLVAVWHFRARYLVQVVATPLHIALFYTIGRALGDGSRLVTVLAWAGMNSLVGYIAHVAVLQVLVQILKPRQTEPIVAGFILMIAVCGTALAIYAGTRFKVAAKRTAGPVAT